MGGCVSVAVFYGVVNGLSGSMISPKLTLTADFPKFDVAIATHLPLSLPILPEFGPCAYFGRCLRSHVAIFLSGSTRNQAVRKEVALSGSRIRPPALPR